MKKIFFKALLTVFLFLLLSQASKVIAATGDIDVSGIVPKKELKIISPLEEKIYSFLPQRVTWQHGEDEYLPRTDHYRFSYIVDDAQFVVSENIPKNSLSYNFDIDESIVINEPKKIALKIDAVNSVGTILESALSYPTLVNPELKILVNNFDAIEPKFLINSQNDFKKRILTEDGVDLTSFTIFNTTVETNAGTYDEQSEILKTGRKTGRYDNAVRIEAKTGKKVTKTDISIILISGNIVQDIIDQITNIVGKIEDIINQVPKETLPLMPAASLAAVGAAALITTIANISATMSLWEYLRMLLFWLFGWRRKKKLHWGRIFEQGSNMSILQAKIMLFKIDSSSKIEKLFATTYSDNDGYYGFLAPIGQYKIVVQKDKYRIIDNKPINVEVNSDNQSIITRDIVMAPTTLAIGKFAHFNFTGVIFAKCFDVLSYLSLIVGTVFVLFNFSKEISWQTLILGITYGVMWLYLIFRYRKRSSPWGHVFVENTSTPIPLALVRIFSAKDHKLIQTVVSDKEGKYSTILTLGNYNLVAMKNGFSQKHELDVKINNKIDAVNQKIYLYRTQ